MHVFFISNTRLKLSENKAKAMHVFFISNTRLKLSENKAKAKQHPEVELLLFENFFSSSTLSFQK